MAVQKEGRGLGESPAAGHSRRDCPTAFKSELKYCCEFLRLFSAVCTALLVLEESLLPCSLCRTTAERAPGPERGRTRANLLSWLADMDVPVKIKVLIPREQLCVLHENHLHKAHLEAHPLLPSLPEKGWDLLISCQVHDCSAEALE